MEYSTFVYKEKLGEYNRFSDDWEWDKAKKETIKDLSPKAFEEIEEIIRQKKEEDKELQEQIKQKKFNENKKICQEDLKFLKEIIKDDSFEVRQQYGEDRRDYLISKKTETGENVEFEVEFCPKRWENFRSKKVNSPWVARFNDSPSESYSRKSYRYKNLASSLVKRIKENYEIHNAFFKRKKEAENEKENKRKNLENKMDSLDLEVFDFKYSKWKTEKVGKSFSSKEESIESGILASLNENLDTYSNIQIVGKLSEGDFLKLVKFLKENVSVQNSYLSESNIY